METWIKVIVAGAGATASYLYGGWSSLLGILLVFVVADYISGFVAAAVEGKLSSAVGVRGIARKVFIFVMVAMAHLVDTALGEANLLRDATIFFYLANELLSVIENAGRIGVPVPPLISQAVEVLRKRGEAR